MNADMKKWAEDQIKRDQDNVDELMQLRAEAWNKGDRTEYSRLTGYIKELNEGIQALKESYGEEAGK